MPNNRITALPSTVRYQDGDEVLLQAQNEKDLLSLQSQMCYNAGKKMSDYYSNNPEEWKTFVNIVKSEK